MWREVRSPAPRCSAGERWRPSRLRTSIRLRATAFAAAAISVDRSAPEAAWLALPEDREAAAVHSPDSRAQALPRCLSSMRPPCHRPACPFHLPLHPSQPTPALRRGRGLRSTTVLLAFTPP